MSWLLDYWPNLEFHGLEFTVNGPPVGYQRVGVANRRFYTQKETKKYMAYAGASAMAAVVNQGVQGKWPTCEWVYLDIAIYAKKQRNGRWPDGANVLKSVEDGCAGILWCDSKGNPDDRCVLGRVQRLVPNDPNPRVEVCVTLVSELREVP